MIAIDNVVILSDTIVGVFLQSQEVSVLQNR